MKNKFKSLKRRDVLIGASVLTGAAVLASCDDKIDGGTPDKPKESASISKNIIQWRMATTWPKNFPGVGTTAENVAKDIVKNSELELLFPNVDNWYYAQQSSNMYYSGLESISSLGQIFTNLHVTNFIYHYFDLWLISIFSETTNAPSIIALLINFNTFLIRHFL